MKDMFKVELVWRNCAIYPPEEPIDRLFITDGESFHKARYHPKYGWWCVELWSYIPPDLLKDYWWANILQAINGVSDFKIGEC